METWVLIAFFGYKTGGFTAEFSSEENCKAAIVALGDPLISRDQRIFCIKK